MESVSLIDFSSGLKSDIQLINSMSHLDKKKSNGILRVTELRVKSNDEEYQRRLKEEENRHERMVAVENEAKQSSRFRMKENDWKSMLESKTLEGLKEGMEKLKRRMQDAVDIKAKMIQQLRHEIKRKDEGFVNALNENTSAIEELRQRITQESKRMALAYRLEMNAIDEAFLEDRMQLLTEHKKEINGLMLKKKAVELKWIQKQNHRRSQFENEADQEQAKGDDQYNKLKIKLEKDVHQLEYKLEDVRASHQLNEDKLEHNLRTLVEKDNDNRNLIKKQKKKFLKIKQDLCRVKESLAENETKNKRKLDIIEFEYRRIERQYEMLQNQFVHFEVADKKKSLL